MRFFLRHLRALLRVNLRADWSISNTNTAHKTNYTQKQAGWTAELCLRGEKKQPRKPHLRLYRCRGQSFVRTNWGHQSKRSPAWWTGKTKPIFFWDLKTNKTIWKSFKQFEFIKNFLYVHDSYLLVLCWSQHKKSRDEIEFTFCSIFLNVDIWNVDWTWRVVIIKKTTLWCDFCTSDFRIVKSRIVVV